MISPSGIKKIVREHERGLDISSRANMDRMVCFVSDLLKEAGDKETATKVLEFYYDLENMDAGELARERIWDEERK